MAQKPLVIYHAHCLDGFTAAWAASKALGPANYFAAVHGGYPPRVRGRAVYILDYAYPREWLLDMRRAARFLKVIDHHEGARQDLADLPFATFDNNRSGAGLTWDLLVRQPRPLLIDFVEDVDLWRWSLPWAREALERLNLEPRTFAVWDELASWDAAAWERFASEGTGLRARYVHDLAWYFDARHTVTIAGVRGYAAHAASAFASELGHLLAQESGTFGLVYGERDGRLVGSLRSIAPFSVLPLAKAMCGGGHAQAAGFSIPLSAVPRLLPEVAYVLGLTGGGGQ